MGWPYINGALGFWSVPLGLWWLTCGGVATLRAQTTCENLHITTKVVVALTFEGPALRASLEQPTMDALSASLADGFVLCPPGSPAAQTAAARITIRTTRDQRIAIEVHDRVTDKQLLRELSLADFTWDSRPLAVAIACDELLRASWLELSLAHLDRQRATAPPAVTAAVEHDLQRSRPPENAESAIFVRGAINSYSGGTTLFGGDVGAHRWLSRKFALSLGLGGRRGLVHRNELGRVRLSGAALELAGQYIVLGDREANMRARVSAFSMLTYVDARARENADARSRVGLTSSIRFGLGGQAILAPFLAMDWGLDVGPSLVSLQVQADGEELTSTSGLEIQVSLGLDVGR